MKRFILGTSLICLAVFSTSYTRPAHAQPRYGWDERYYVYDSSYACGLEVGHDIRTCGGASSQGGNLSAPFKHTYMVECSSGLIIDDNYYFYCPTTGPWILWGCPSLYVPC